MEERLAKLNKLARLIRYFSLVATTEAGSGHPTSSLSAADLMAALFFGGFFRFDLARPDYPGNDRLIFSKGHASPLLYALFAAAGAVSETELLTFRKFGSRLEGHPTPAFPYTEAATGSLGQGLSVGLGMALCAKYVDKAPYRTFVLLGDSEMAEGSVWEALALAAHYRLDNLVAILDVNRLGQRGETMEGHDVGAYARKVRAFGWEAVVIDGHRMGEIIAAYRSALSAKGKPAMIIAKTLKGKGVSFLENKEGWHGKALSKDELRNALSELGAVDARAGGAVAKPPRMRRRTPNTERRKTPRAKAPHYPRGDAVATRKAYGDALVLLLPKHPHMLVLDAEVGNSTHAEDFKNACPERFFEMYIAEQNMVGAALGLARRGKLPFVSTFAAFFTRAFDQIRMSQYSGAHIVFTGSHAGVSIGEDGASQMGLEDLAMFRAISGSTVLYPSDAYAACAAVAAAARADGICYIRTTRAKTPLLYTGKERFSIGASKVLRQSGKDRATLVAAGVTLFEALAAYEELLRRGIAVRVIDLWSVKPLDEKTLRRAARETGRIITVEDHYPEGGIGEAVAAALAGSGAAVHALAVRTAPRSGKPAELLAYEEIDAQAIIKTVMSIIV